MVGKVFFAADADRENRAAMALYDCDEDLTDEGISDLISRGYTPPTRSTPREPWPKLLLQTRQAYLRRARSVLAAAEYPVREPRKTRV